MSGFNSPVLVIGGAGFIGTNLAGHLARSGRRVRIYDDLSRSGVDRNLAWLQRTYGDRIETRIADVRDRRCLRDAIGDANAVFHLAASRVDPRHDFEVNALGTLEVLEAIRESENRPPLVYTSTDKVYGGLADLVVRDSGARWEPVDEKILVGGIDESRRLEFRTPYGCSKGCADQYVLDYAQTYGIAATVFRLSSVYGPHQRGTEDHGWVAHFLTRALRGEPVTVYGDGKQVRDLLFIDDLVEAFVRAWSRIGAIAGRAFNIGGGPTSTITINELVGMIEALHGHRPDVHQAGWCAGHRRYYASDTRAFTAATGWQLRVRPRAGVEALFGWLSKEVRHA